MDELLGKIVAGRGKKICCGLLAACFFAPVPEAVAVPGTGVLYEVLKDASGRRDMSAWNARVKEAFPMEIQLQGADFAGAYLEKADLRSADLRGADFRSADLRGVVLSSADLRGADFSKADLRGADLRGADLRGTDLSDTSIEGIDVRGARFPQGST